MVKNYIDTLKNLLIHPRDVIDGFIHSGKDHSFQHPFLFSVIGMMIIVLLNTLLIDFSVSINPDTIQPENEQVQQIAEWVQVTTIRMSTQLLPLVMVLLLIPMLSLPGLFFFRDETGGFYANLILNTYTVGASILIQLAAIPVWIFSPLSLTDPFMNTTLPGLLVATVGIWIYKNYFSVSDLAGWIRILSSYISGYVLFIIVKGLAAGIIGYMIFAVNRIREISGDL